MAARCRDNPNKTAARRGKAERISNAKASGRKGRAGPCNQEREEGNQKTLQLVTITAAGHLQ